MSENEKPSSSSSGPDLTAIRARLKKATDGPWAWESIAEKSNEFAVGTAFDKDGNPLKGRLPESEWVEDAVIERRGLIGINESGHANFADADFIAHARQDIPALVDEVDRLRADLAEEQAAYRLARGLQKLAESRLRALETELDAIDRALSGLMTGATGDSRLASIERLYRRDVSAARVETALTALRAQWREDEAWSRQHMAFNEAHGNIQPEDAAETLKNCAADLDACLAGNANRSFKE